MRGAIIFQGIYLMPGSQAHKLHTEKKWSELQAHMKELEQKKQQLEGKKQ
jgi:hypothetical protein